MGDLLQNLDLAALVEANPEVRTNALVGLINYMSDSPLAPDLNRILYKQIHSAENYIVDACLKIKNESERYAALEEIAKSGMTNVAIKALDEVALIPDTYVLYNEDLFESQILPQEIKEFLMKINAGMNPDKNFNRSISPPEFLETEYLKMEILSNIIVLRNDEVHDYAFKLLLETQNETVKAKGMVDLVANNVKNPALNEEMYQICVNSVVELKDKEITEATLYQMYLETMMKTSHQLNYEMARKNTLLILNYVALFKECLRQEPDTKGNNTLDHLVRHCADDYKLAARAKELLVELKPQYAPN